MSKYKIWNKIDTIFTPGPPGKFTPEEWLEQYPWAEVAPCVISGTGTFNGAFCMPLDEMVAQAEAMGCDFSACETAEDKLATIEAFEIAKAKEQEESAIAAREAELAVLEMEAAAAQQQAEAVQAIADGQTTENAAALDLLLNGEE